MHHLPFSHVKQIIPIADFPPPVYWFVSKCNAVRALESILCFFGSHNCPVAEGHCSFLISRVSCLIIFIIIVSQSVKDLVDGLDDRGLVVRFLGGARIFHLPTISIPTLGPPNLVSRGRICFLCIWNGWTVNTNTHLQLIPRLGGAIPQFLHTPSLREQGKLLYPKLHTVC